ncbi:hypothetical protein HUJ05_007445 [Dendroctonus ponderosae]|nr:hypothetical protein HUJ05_007445 [Dendroctonus ponderosae]
MECDLLLKEDEFYKENNILEAKTKEMLQKVNDVMRLVVKRVDKKTSKDNAFFDNDFFPEIIPLRTSEPKQVIRFFFYFEHSSGTVTVSNRARKRRANIVDRNLPRCFLSAKLISYEQTIRRRSVIQLCEIFIKRVISKNHISPTMKRPSRSSLESFGFNGDLVDCGRDVQQNGYRDQVLGAKQLADRLQAGTDLPPSPQNPGLSNGVTTASGTSTKINQQDFRDHNVKRTGEERRPGG